MINDIKNHLKTRKGKIGLLIVVILNIWNLFRNTGNPDFGSIFAFFTGTIIFYLIFVWGYSNPESKN